MKTFINRVSQVLKKIIDDRPSIQVNLLHERHGSEYGGWSICPDDITSNSTVYSFGVGEDASFDLSLIAHYGLNIFAFDPTPKSIQWMSTQSLAPTFHLLEYGLADYDGVALFNPPENSAHVSYTMLDRPSTAAKSISVPVKQLTTIMKELGHKKIDILKMDIEGEEYAVIEHLKRSNVEITQLLVEFHHRFENVGYVRTQQAVDSLNSLGYKIFYISPKGNEFSFIRL